MKNLIIPAALAVILASTQAHAGHPLSTDDTGTQGAGKYQFELNGEYGHDREHASGTTAKAYGIDAAAAFSAGVTETIDVVVSVPFLWKRELENGTAVSSGAGISDVTVEAKWRFLESGPVSLAIKPGISFPTGSEGRGFGNGRISYGAAMIATAKVGETAAIHANVSYAHNEFGSAENRREYRADIVGASIAGSVEVAKGVQLVADVGASTNCSRSEGTWPVYALGGVIWSVNDQIDLDAGIKGGLTRPETDIAGLAGVTYHF